MRIRVGRLHRRSVVWLLGAAAACAVAFMSVMGAGAAVSTKAVVGYFGGTGTEAGQLKTPRGTAVNQSNGNVYVVDGGSNERVVEFNSTGQFLRTFGQGVVESGPDLANETQTITVDAASGKYKLSFGSGGVGVSETAEIEATATATQVQSALNAITNVSNGGGLVVVTGGPGNGAGSAPYIVTFSGGPLAHTNVPQITATNVSLSGGSPTTSVTTATQNEGATGYDICTGSDHCQAGTTGSVGDGLANPEGIAINQATGNLYVTDLEGLRVQEFGPNGEFLRAFGQAVVASGPDNSTATNAVQTLSVAATGGQYTLSFGGKTTAGIAYNAIASVIQTALTGLSSIGGGNATVSEVKAGEYKVTFSGALANNPEPLIVAASAASPNELVGFASVSNTTTGTTGFDACVAANGDVCKTGTSASAGGAFKSNFNGYPTVAPVGAPNAGNVLVSDPANLRVQEFSSTGAFVRAFGLNVVSAGPDNNGTTNFEVCTAANGDACQIGSTGSGSGTFANSVNRVAEDASGDIYTVESGTNFRVQKFTLPGNVVTPQGNFSEANLKGTAATNGPLDVVIDPSDEDLLVAKAFAAGATASCPNTGAPSVAERRIVEVNSAGILQTSHMACAGINAVIGLSTNGSTGAIYAASTTEESRVYVLNTPLSPPTAIFSNVSNVTAHGAAASGAVNPNGPAPPYGLTTGYHVAYKRAADSSFSAAPPADINVGGGTTNVVVFQQLVGLEAGTTYEVQIVAERPFNGGSASTAIYSFTTPAAAPEITIPTSVTGDPTGTTASLYGSVNPQSRETIYRFEYGPTTSYGNVGEGSAGVGATSIAVSQLLSGLQADTTYHFRLRANNSSGGVASPDETFTTASPTETELPDNRKYELVSPANKGAVGTVLLGLDVSDAFQASEDGESFIYPILNGLEGSTAGGEVIYNAKRGSSGWSSTQVSPSTQRGPSRVMYFSPNLSCGIVQSSSPQTGNVPSVDEEDEVTNLYLRNQDGSVTLITDVAPTNTKLNVVNGEYYIIAGASPDCKRVYFYSPYAFTLGASGLYEWNEGILQDIGILPDGHLAPPVKATEANPLIGGESTNPRSSRFNAVSEDGDHFVFTSLSDEGNDSGQEAVFVRIGSAHTVDASKPSTATHSLGARYETASPDGSQIFFAANLGLAGPAGNGPQENCAASEAGTTTACDLYDYSVETGTLTDLTTDNNQADVKGAAVQGVVGVSRDGSYVYFEAKGQLIPGSGRTHAQNSVGGANLYVAHAGQLHYVASVSTSNTQDLMRYQGAWNAYVSPSGENLVFETNNNIMGYESGGRPEVYLYSLRSENLTCVSCRANGQPSNTITQTGQPKEGLPGLVLNGQPQLYYARPMSENGSRVFFTVGDALAPGGITSSSNLYEWHEGQVRLITSEGRLRDSSGNGNNVFFTSPEGLVPEDVDGTWDAYDARVEGGFPPAVEPPSPCEPVVGQCQGLGIQAPTLSGIFSEGFVGAGNLIPSGEIGSVGAVGGKQKPGRPKAKKSKKRKSRQQHKKKKAGKTRKKNSQHKGSKGRPRMQGGNHNHGGAK